MQEYHNTADKDKAVKVIEYMKKTNMEWLNSGVVSNIGAEADERARYSFRRFLLDNKLLHGDYLERGDDLVIECPFHRDDSPSCSVNERKYVYNCFSCGNHGNLVSLITDYKAAFENSHLNYYQTLNDILSKDRVMTAELGFDTIFISNKVTFTSVNVNSSEILEQLRPFKFKLPKGTVLPRSYSELADILIKRNASIKQIKLFITLIQDNVEVENIYKEIFNDFDSATENETTEAISLEQLIAFDD